jgi:hypothetical protein
MIIEIFTNKGQTKSKKDTFDELVKLNANDIYKRQKAGASIGGSITSGYIEVVDNSYRCTRDPKKC